MPSYKRIVCLANSRKNNGRCVAGIELIDDKIAGWVRPVTDDGNSAVSELDRRYSDGTDPKVLDVIEIPMRGHAPQAHQVENWLFDPDYHWKLSGRLSWRDLPSLVTKEADLWLQGSDDSYNGLNDRVSHSEINECQDSLRLIWVDTVMVRVEAPGAPWGNPKRRVSADFEYSGIRYRLWVTDPVVERNFLREENGVYELQDCYLTVSLGEIHGGYYYKLIAALLTRDRIEVV